MRIINKKYLLIILLLGVILTGVIVLKPKEEVKLDNVILKQEVNNRTFAMYKETDSGYEEYKDTKFPDMYVLNIEKSKCIDNNGNELNGVLSYENDKVVLTTNKSSYCYLYFDKSLGLEIKEKNPDGLKTDKKRGEMYRYQGQAKDLEGNELVDNYICFGTSDKDQCIKNQDKHMYRIIGIEAETGRVKVIKKEALNSTVQWWDNYDDNIEFPKSKIYEAISGTGFLKNTDYVPENWEEKIANNTWMYGDMLNNDTLGARQTGEELYKTETGQKEAIWDAKAEKGDEGVYSTVVENDESSHNGETIYYTRHTNEKWTETFNSKVSLMYLHDYYYSVSDTANCQLEEGHYDICKLGWMHLSNNDTSPPYHSEWIMSRAGYMIGSGFFSGFWISYSGAIGAWSLHGELSVRPTFYINTSEELLDGEGTIDNPFIIK